MDGQEPGLDLRELAEAVCTLVGIPAALVGADSAPDIEMAEPVPSRVGAVTPTAATRRLNNNRDLADLVNDVLIAGIGLHIDFQYPR